jgi:hypothetical protein
LRYLNDYFAVKQGPSFRHYFASNFMANFSDAARALPAIADWIKRR